MAWPRAVAPLRRAAAANAARGHLALRADPRAARALRVARAGPRGGRRARAAPRARRLALRASAHAALLLRLADGGHVLGAVRAARHALLRAEAPAGVLSTVDCEHRAREAQTERARADRR